MAPQPASDWLPELCTLPRLATLFGVAEMVVLILGLSPASDGAWTAQQFLAASGLALWLTLAISVVLCVLRRRALGRLPVALGAPLALLVAALIGMAGAGMLHQLDRTLSVGMVPPDIGLARFALGSAALSTLLTAVVLRYLYVHESWQAQVRASAQARADALQARIRPHFLFNSMNTIASLLGRDPALAERAVLDLSDLFRAALGPHQAGSSLRGEVQLAEQYLAIEQLRLGERLQVRWQREESLPWDREMPLLVLQPLVENAVLHGVSLVPEGGCVEITLAGDSRRLTMHVRNPAPPPRVSSDAGPGAGHALRNIEERLRHAFGSGVRMNGGWQAGYYDCEVRIPLA